MGMFDYVRCEPPLPDGFTGDMQSKDFDCSLSIILIRHDGRLLIEDSDWEEVPKAERPYPDADDSDPMRLIGSMRPINRRWRDLNFHGVFCFYGVASEAWHEYTAKFTDGQLVGIEQVPA